MVERPRPGPADRGVRRAATGLTVEPDPRLREYDVGERSGLTLAEFAAELSPRSTPRGSRRTRRAAVPGEETTEEVRDRIVPALLDCLAALEPGETGIVVLQLLCWSPDFSVHLFRIGRGGYSNRGVRQGPGGAHGLR